MVTYLDPGIDASEFPVVDIDAGNLASVRETGFAWPRELSDRVERTRHDINEHVGVIVHRPVGHEGPLPAHYAIHGGGYVAGSTAMDDARFDSWCPRLGLIGVAVDYRLAPETPFPGPLEDCYAGLAWTFEHAAELGIDADMIGIGGVSAGGGLCAALALLVRDRAEFDVRYQLLDCPMLDDRMASHSSRRDDLLVWSRASNDFGWRCYLGELHGGDVPAYAAAARATDLAGLPPAWVAVGTADGFCDEDIEYARRLIEADVPTELHVYPGAPHGVQVWVGSAPAKAWSVDQFRWLANQLARQS